MIDLMDLVKNVVKEDTEYILYTHDMDTHTYQVQAFTTKEKVDEYVQKNCNNHNMLVGKLGRLDYKIMETTN